MFSPTILPITNRSLSQLQFIKRQIYHSTITGYWSFIIANSNKSKKEIPTHSCISLLFQHSTFLLYLVILYHQIVLRAVRTSIDNSTIITANCAWIVNILHQITSTHSIRINFERIHRDFYETLQYVCAFST